MGNHWFNQRLVIFGSTLLAIFGLYLMYAFHYYASLRIRRGEKIFYCLIIDRIFAFNLLVMKLVMCFEPRLYFGYRHGCFHYESNAVLVKVWLAVIPTLWIPFFLIKMSFKGQLFLSLYLFILCIWFMYFYTFYQKKTKDKIEHKLRLYSGLTSNLSAHELDFLKNRGYKVEEKPFGYGTQGTTYKCGLVTDINKEYKFVLKVIDFKEWEKNRKPTEPEKKGVEWLRPDTYRTLFLNWEHRLSAIDAMNVLKYESIHHQMGAFTTVYMITRLAQMNLKTFLTKYMTNGVSDEWAREWFHQLCDGLFYLHEVFESVPFPHINIKPENILLFRKKSQKGINYFKFVRNDDQINDSQSQQIKAGPHMKDQYILKLSDCGLDNFLPANGRVVTRMDSPIVISPPRKLVGNKNIRVINEKPTNEEKKFNDIYQMAVILILLLKGDIKRLIATPKDTERIHNYVTAVDAIYIRLDKPELIKTLLKNKPKELYFLLKKMMVWEPTLRFDIKQVLDSDWMKIKSHSK